MIMEVFVCTNRTETTIEQLVGLWDRSVRVSHGFLTENDIEWLRPVVRQAVREMGDTRIGGSGRG